MDELETYRSSVDRYWPAVDRFLDELPADRYRQGRLLRETLAVRSSATGDFHDILRRPDDHPLLHYHLWLLDDLAIPPGDTRRSIESHLFAAMVYTLAVGLLRRDIGAADSFFDASFLDLSDALTRQIGLEFSAVVDPDSKFWETYRAVWDAAPDDGSTEARQAPFILSGMAVIEAVERTELRRPLLEMLQHLNAVLAMQHDLTAIRRDLAQGTITRPVRFMIEALTEDAAADAEGVLGSLLLSGAVDTLAPIWGSDLEALERHATALGLPTLERYGRHLEAVLEAVQGALRLHAIGSPSGMETPRFEPASDPVSEAIVMAERFLVADPTFRDAWEVHRWGMAGAAEVTARFPAGLVIEALGRHGHDVADLVDEFYRGAGQRGFAYYDHPALPYVETDTLGTMLRLYPYTKQTEWHRETLDRFIDLLVPSIGVDGRLPVWLGDDAPHALLGEHCGAIEANLLRGLLAYDPDRLAPIVDASARRLLADFAERGAGITVNYQRTYLLAVLSTLLGELDRYELGGATEEADRRLADEVQLAARRDRSTPMTTASLMLACSAAAIEQDERWPTAVLQGQSFDGGWAGEPIFFAPNRARSVTWHASRLLTSAVCYDALATFKRGPGA